MERLNAQQKNLAKALNTLNSVVEAYYKTKQNEQTDEIQMHIYQAAVIKHFEISFDLLWKYLKQLLHIHYGIDVASPKKVFHEAGLQKLLTDAQVDIFLTMCDNRNLTAHTYDVDYAYEVAETVLHYYFVIKPALFAIITQLNDPKKELV